MKKTKAEIRKELRKFFDSHYLMDVSTCFKDARPHTSAMLFVADRQNRIYIITHRETLKSSQLLDNPYISGVLYEINSLYVQWSGKAKEVKNESTKKRLMEKFAARALEIKNFWPPIFKFFGEDYVIFQATPTWLRVMDLSVGAIHDKESKMYQLI